jgi:hypothetical protein
MTRKLLIKILAALCMAKSLWDVGEFLYPIFFLPPPFPIKITPLVGGILGVYAGFNLFRLQERGRKLVLILSYVFAAMITLITLWTLFFWKDGYASAIYYFDREIIAFTSRFVAAGVDLIFLAIPVLIIFFLSQKKTKLLFAPQTMENIDSKVSVELM